MLGFGTWQLAGAGARDAVHAALDVGYRHIDTATMYENEKQVGDAVRLSGVAREEVFITTKLPPSRAARARQTLEQSLRSLGTDYVDLWLIHWPIDDEPSPPTWRAMLDARDAGLAKAVGVSNYDPAQIDELIDATGEAPAINQIPWSPGLHDEKQLAYLRERDVVVEGYSPFKRSNLKASVLREIAESHGKTAAQIIVRWHVQHDIVVIPKSANADRIAENFDVWDFSLSADEMARIDRLAG